MTLRALVVVALLALVGSAGLWAQGHGEEKGPVTAPPVEVEGGASKDGHPEPGSTHAAEEEHHDDSSILWKWANFALLVAGLGYLAAKQGGAFFRQRNAEIQEGLAAAAAMKAEAEAKVADIDRRLGNLQAEVADVRHQAHEELERERARQAAATDAAVQRLQQQAQSSIAAALKEAQHELRSHAARLAMDVAEERVRQRLTPETQQGLVSRFVVDLGRSTPKGTR